MERPHTQLDLQAPHGVVFSERNTVICTFYRIGTWGRETVDRSWRNFAGTLSELHLSHLLAVTPVLLNVDLRSCGSNLRTLASTASAAPMRYLPSQVLPLRKYCLFSLYIPRLGQHHCVGQRRPHRSRFFQRLPQGRFFPTPYTSVAFSGSHLHLHGCPDAALNTVGAWAR
jgi:hypothetical protein